MADFIIRALLAGIAVALAAGPLGCFVVWRRMAYFGDTLAHSALLGIALGLLFDVNLQLSVIVACVILALALGLLERNRQLATDTLLGILAHSALAFGLVVLSYTDVQIDLMNYLFGDLLTVTSREVAGITLCSLLSVGLLALYWKRLLIITLNPELAQVEGLNVDRLKLVLMVLMALVVAVSMKVIGILLITALLIIPPAAARRFATTPEGMAMCASAIGVLAVCGGMLISFYWDTLTGPSIVVTAAALFLLSQFRK